MPVSRRLLSLLLWWVHRAGSWRTLAAVIMCIVALFRLANAGWQAGLTWGLPAAFLLLAGAYVDARGYMLFAADDSIGLLEGGRAGFHRSVASGWFLQRHWSGLLMLAAVSGEGFQVRWLSRNRPPCLAVIQPAELPESTYSPLEVAECFACWYPGSNVRLGWVADGWAVHPGLELQFIGKRLVLALRSEGEARALAEVLQHSA